MPGVPLDFTDGDTSKRFTVTSPDIAPTSIIDVSIQRGVIADADDWGWGFAATVVNVVAGSFDVNVSANVWGEPAVNDEAPNEQVTLLYSITGRYPY